MTKGKHTWLISTGAPFFVAIIGKPFIAACTWI
jgi:hypothetical protein